jgi:hypothetical protein
MQGGQNPGTAFTAPPQRATANAPLRAFHGAPDHVVGALVTTRRGNDRGSGEIKLATIILVNSQQYVCCCIDIGDQKDAHGFC